MPKRKFTIFLMPLEEGGYQVFFPHYPSCVTDGMTIEEALKNAEDAMTGCLEADAKNGGDLVPPYVHASHVVVGEVEIEVPESLIEAKPEKKARQPAGD